MQMNRIPIEEIKSARCTLEILYQNIQEALAAHKKENGHYPWDQFEKFQISYRFFYEAWQDWGSDPDFKSYFKAINGFEYSLDQTLGVLLQLRLKTEYVLD